MAWALQFDGSSYANLSSAVTLTGDFDINFKFKSSATIPSTMAIVETNVGSNGWLGRWQGNFLFYWGGVIHADRPFFSPDTEYTVRLWRTGSTCQYTINGVTYTSFTNSNDLVITRFSDVGSSKFAGYIEYFTINGVHNWSPDASDRSGSTDQPILTDTVGGNDATGVNFPSFDASVWDDLGGGGSINVSGSLTIPAPTLIGNLTKTNPSFDSSGSVVISKPDLSGQLSATLPQFNTSISVTIPKPQLSAIGNNTKPNFDSSASITIPPPVVAGNISNGVGVISLNGNVTVSKPLLGGSLSKSNPQFNTAGSLLIAKPVLTGVLSKSVPIVDLSGNVSISKPLASGGLSKSEPIFNASGSITISKPQITGNLVNGTINITFNAETNYNQPYLTSNFSQPNQSTVYVQPYKSTNRSQ